MPWHSKLTTSLSTSSATPETLSVAALVVCRMTAFGQTTFGQNLRFGVLAVLPLVGCVLLFCGCCVWYFGCSTFSGRVQHFCPPSSSQTSPPPKPPPADRPKFRFFFSHIFLSFFLSCGLLVEFWWCFRSRDPQMCTSSRGRPAEVGGHLLRGPHRDRPPSRTASHHLHQGREETKKNVGRGTKSAKFWAPPPFGALPRPVRLGPIQAFSS